MVATPDLRGSGSAASDTAELAPLDVVLVAPTAGRPLLMLVAPLEEEDLKVQSALYSLRAMEIMCAAITLETPG